MQRSCIATRTLLLGVSRLQCANCGRVGTLAEVSPCPRHRITREPECPTCCAYARAHGGTARPPRLWHRERQQLLEGAAEPGADIHKCCHCGMLPRPGRRHEHFHRRCAGAGSACCLLLARLGMHTAEEGPDNASTAWLCETMGELPYIRHLAFTSPHMPATHHHPGPTPLSVQDAGAAVPNV